MSGRPAREAQEAAPAGDHGTSLPAARLATVAEEVVTLTADSWWEEAAGEGAEGEASEAG